MNRIISAADVQNHFGRITQQLTSSWQTELDELHQLASAELQKRPLPEPVKILTTMRDERDADLEAALDLL